MLEDAAPMAAAEQLGQVVMEFDPTATVETVVIEESEEVVVEESFEIIAEEVTPESENSSDKTK
jgi:segregation and condensation protein B